MEESGISLDSTTADQLLIYFALLKKWNSRINLTSSTEWAAIKPLFQEGMWASRLYSADAIAHLDIGSGAGFPAILLRILRPRIKLDMVESREKKCIFLETVVDSLRLDDTKVHCMELSTFLHDRNNHWDCITWKGLKLNTDDLISLCSNSSLNTRLWMFHGKGLAVKEPKVVEQYLRLIQTEKFENRREWNLSIFVPKLAFHVKHTSIDADH
jgi:16S rRNA (guanine(527)-N(7))-methyltransferase RsmG